MAGGPFVFLDDDPTGVQAVAGVPVVLRWREPSLSRVMTSGTPSVHVLTNSRALSPPEAEATVYDAARAVVEAAPGSPILLRGDSTLRGHLLEEYRAVWRARELSRPPVLLLVPALPAAGRVTLRGVHHVMRDGHATPVNETEYARDGVFAYRSARLLDWAQERSAGLIAAADGVEIPLRTLRERGPDAVVQALAAAARRGVAAACVPDAEEIDDLRLIADGFRAALMNGSTAIVRCAPTFAGVLTGTLAQAEVAAPAVNAGVLIICGSYVANTSVQLEYLREHRGLAAIELDPAVLAGGAKEAEVEVQRAAKEALAALEDHRLALVATQRDRPPETRHLEAGMRIARWLARVATLVGVAADVVVAKGGITSAVTLTDGLGAADALVVGPVMPGVALWRPRLERALSYLVVPGNVGSPPLLAELLDRLGV